MTATRIDSHQQHTSVAANHAEHPSTQRSTNAAASTTAVVTGSAAGPTAGSRKLAPTSAAAPSPTASPRATTARAQHNAAPSRQRDGGAGGPA